MNAPKTVDELIAWFERSFMCMQGAARAYLEVPVGPGGAVHRWVYDTHVLVTDLEPDHEQLLVEALHRDFARFADEEATTLLIWRLPQKIELACDQRKRLGACVATKEQIEDGVRLSPIGPQFAEDQCGNWHEFLGWDTRWKLRTRLVIPALQWSKDAWLLRSRLSEGASEVSL